MSLLPEEEVRQALMSLPGWTLESACLVREWRFESFSDAMVFVNRVAEAAEEADHHPDIEVRYRQVRLSLTSHDAGGITRRDVRMARRISEWQTENPENCPEN